MNQKTQSTFLKFFAILDFISLVRLLPTQFNSLFSYGISNAFSCYSLGLYVFILSLAFSTYAFLQQKKWGFILYYMQIIPRLGIAIFSFGFLISLLNLFTVNLSAKTYIVLTILLVGLELTRLGFTIYIHKNSTSN